MRAYFGIWLLFAAPTLLLANGFYYFDGHVVDLGNDLPVAINESGQLLESRGSSFFLVDNNGSTKVGLNGSSLDVYGHLNNLGQVLGYSTFGLAYHPFFYSGCITTDLSSYIPSGQQAAGAFFNNKGEVLLGTIPDPFVGPFSETYTLINNGTAQSLGRFFVSGNPGDISDFNSSDVLIGAAGTVPFFWKSGVVTTFASLDPAFHFSNSLPEAINDRGEVIAYNFVSSDGFGYFYDGVKFTPFPYFRPFKLSENGQVVGGENRGLGVVLLNGVVLDPLANLGGPNHFIQYSSITGVNNRGEVVGTFTEVFVPEPQSVLLTATGAACLLFLRQRKLLHAC